VPVDRDGIEIDYCPHCRGVWLDRGELDKLIEAASRRQPPSTSARAYRDFEEVEDHHYHPKSPRKRKRLKSFLEDLFDFD